MGICDWFFSKKNNASDVMNELGGKGKDEINYDKIQKPFTNEPDSDMNKKNKLEQNNANNRISFEELIERLKIWIEVSDDDTLGQGFGNAPYWHFSYQNQSYVINSDTNKIAVITFISMLDVGEEIKIIPSGGKRNKMICGEDAIPGLYIYESLR